MDVNSNSSLVALWQTFSDFCPQLVGTLVSIHSTLSLEEVLNVGDRDRSSTSRSSFHVNAFLVSKETVALRRWECETKMWFYQTS